MKMMKIGIAAALAATLFLSGCQMAGVTSPETAEAPRALQTWSLWDPMDSFQSGVWEKANWTNGGMFNCGWLPSKVGFSGGKLNLTLDGTDSHGKTYSSGEYRTWNTFSYGRFETSMKAVKKSGTVSSFFLYTGNPWDEIDVEILGKDTTKVQFNYFVNGVGGHEKVVNLGFDASTGYHTYAIEYGNGYINWYVDGNWKWGVNNQGLNAPYGAPMPSHPMQIMVNLWPGIGVDSWLGPFNYTSPLTASYDWVKYNP